MKKKIKKLKFSSTLLIKTKIQKIAYFLMGTLPLKRDKIVIKTIKLTFKNSLKKLNVCSYILLPFFGRKRLKTKRILTLFLLILMFFNFELLTYISKSIHPNYLINLINYLAVPIKYNVSPLLKKKKHFRIKEKWEHYIYNKREYRRLLLLRMKGCGLFAFFFKRFNSPNLRTFKVSTYKDKNFRKPWWYTNYLSLADVYSYKNMLSYNVYKEELYNDKKVEDVAQNKYYINEYLNHPMWLVDSREYLEGIRTKEDVPPLDKKSLLLDHDLTQMRLIYHTLEKKHLNDELKLPPYLFSDYKKYLTTFSEIPWKKTLTLVERKTSWGDPINKCAFFYYIDDFIKRFFNKHETFTEKEYNICLCFLKWVLNGENFLVWTQKASYDGWGKIIRFVDFIYNRHRIIAKFDWLKAFTIQRKIHMNWVRRLTLKCENWWINLMLPLDLQKLYMPKFTKLVIKQKVYWKRYNVNKKVHKPWNFRYKEQMQKNSEFYDLLKIEYKIHNKKNKYWINTYKKYIKRKQNKRITWWKKSFEKKMLYHNNLSISRALDEGKTVKIKSLMASKFEYTIGNKDPFIFNTVSKGKKNKEIFELHQMTSRLFNSIRIISALYYLTTSMFGDDIWPNKKGHKKIMKGLKKSVLKY